MKCQQALLYHIWMLKLMLPLYLSLKHCDLKSSLPSSAFRNKLLDYYILLYWLHSKYGCITLWLYSYDSSKSRIKVDRITLTTV